MTAQVRRVDDYRVTIVAGEASGDLLGAGLMRSLKKQLPSIQFIGVGGEAMTKEGLHSLLPMQDLAVMGLVEVLPRLPVLIRHINRVADETIRYQSNLLITIDSPDFSFRVAQKVHAAGVPCVHYVSPHVWAWRGGRVRKMATFLSHVLALFPFEEAFYKQTGLPCTFVGHPVSERLGALAPTGAEKPLSATPKVALLPGSRKSEITRLWPVFQQAAAQVLAQYPSATFVVPLAPGMTPDDLPSTHPLPLSFVGGDARYATLKSCDAALAASGTANLELAMLGVPMVVAYRLAPLTYLLAKALVKLAYFSPVNLVAGRGVVPEKLQGQANPQTMAAALLPLLADTSTRHAQLLGLAEVREKLRSRGMAPSDRAAQVVITLLKSA
jgi:lipid-A-disaccharide synthase